MRLALCRHSERMAQNRPWRTKTGPQQTYRVEILNPLTIGGVALSAGHVFEVRGIDKKNLDAADLQRTPFVEAHYNSLGGERR